MQLTRLPQLPSYVLKAYAQITEPSTCGGDQPALLFALSSLCGEKGAIVEIGSYVGRSAIALAAGQREKHGCRVVTIDCLLHPNLHKNLECAGLSDWVEVIEGFSHRVSRSWTKPIELLLIDGNHCDWAVKDDLNCWTPFVIEGGYVALHDYGSFEYRGVQRAVYKVLLSRPDKWRVVSDRECGSIIVCQRLPFARIHSGFLCRLRRRLQARDSLTFLWSRLQERFQR